MPHDEWWLSWQLLSRLRIYPTRALISREAIPFKEFGPALKRRHAVQVLGFQRVLSSVTMPFQSPSTKSHLGLTPLGLFLLLQEQVCSSQSEIPKLQHHHFYSLGIMNSIPFHLNQSSSWRWVLWSGHPSQNFYLPHHRIRMFQVGRDP